MFLIRLRRNHLLWTFAAGILWKSQSWDIFARLPTAKCIASCNHDVSLKDDYCVPFIKLKFLISTSHHMFSSPKPSNIYGERHFVSSISRNKLEKYTILRFKKETFLGGKCKWILPKDILSSSPVDAIFLRTFLL